VAFLIRLLLTHRGWLSKGAGGQARAR